MGKQEMNPKNNKKRVQKKDRFKIAIQKKRSGLNHDWAQTLERLKRKKINWRRLLSLRANERAYCLAIIQSRCVVFGCEIKKVEIVVSCVLRVAL